MEFEIDFNFITIQLHQTDATKFMSEQKINIVGPIIKKIIFGGFARLFKKIIKPYLHSAAICETIMSNLNFVPENILCVAETGFKKLYFTGKETRLIYEKCTVRDIPNIVRLGKLDRYFVDMEYDYRE